MYAKRQNGSWNLQNWSCCENTELMGLVCRIDTVTVIILTSVFIICHYFTVGFYRSNYFYSSLIEDIDLTAVCRKAIETSTQTCLHSIVNFQKLKQWICRWPNLSLDSKLLLEQCVVIFYTCLCKNCLHLQCLDDVYTFRLILKKYLYLIRQVQCVVQ